MNKYSIRFNKSRGLPGRGSLDHAWRVFEGNEDDPNRKEYLVKNFRLNVPAFSDREFNTEDWNVACYGILTIDKESSTAIISQEE
jgi:hypothetical protein